MVNITFITEIMNRLQHAYSGARCTLDYENPYQLIVATILSAQCTDVRVNVVTPVLFRHFPDLASLAESDVQILEIIIRSTGFFRSKARNLRGMASMLVERYNGQVPASKEELIKLPGVGIKTANVILANAFGVPALAVDTHVYRVARRLGLSLGTTTKKVEADLCCLFPKSCWMELHHQLISHGRQICYARRPICGHCFISDICPTGLGTITDPHIGAHVVSIA